MVPIPLLLPPLGVVAGRRGMLGPGMGLGARRLRVVPAEQLAGLTLQRVAEPFHRAEAEHIQLVWPAHDLLDHLGGQPRPRHQGADVRLPGAAPRPAHQAALVAEVRDAEPYPTIHTQVLALPRPQRRWRGRFRLCNCLRTAQCTATTP